MRFDQMIEGLQILAKYEPDGLEAHLNGADHDVIWATTAEVDENADQVLDEDGDPVVVDKRVSAEDTARLNELGWYVSPGYGDAWTHYC